MPRRNLWLLFVAAIVSIVCYQKADSAHRSRYGRMFDTFVGILEKIETRYVERVDDRELFEGAIRGMMAELGDPHTAYYNPHEAALSRSQLGQEFGGVGMEVLFDQQTKQLTIVTPLVGSPAYEAGVLAGDKIIEIDGESAEGFMLDDTTRRLRGEPGTTVHIKVLHEGQTETTEIAIRRAIIKTETVLGDCREPDGSWEYFLPDQDRIAYVRVALFGKRTAEELKTVLLALKARGMRGLILDLRNNGGGLLDTAKDTCNLFIRQGLIVSTRGRDRKELDVCEADGSGPLADVPMAVLINRLSASASEIVAACLQDHGRAAIVGTRSFGKGTVQDVLLLEDGKSELRLTIATYWRPSGKNIHRGRKAQDSDDWGVTPDAGSEVKLTDEQWGEILRARRQREIVRRPRDNNGLDEWQKMLADPQLIRALERIQAQLSDNASEVKP